MLISQTRNPKPETLTLRVLDALPRTSIHTARNWSKADVYLVEWPEGSGTRVVVKDMRRCARWFRALAGHLVMRREWKALRALDGTHGVPRAVAKPSSDVLVIEYLAGKALYGWDAKHYPRDATPQIENLVADLHARGVTHGDLHDKNILIHQDENGVQVALIDWATAHVWGTKRNAAMQRLFREFSLLDLRSVAKVKLIYDRQSLRDDELKTLEKGGSTLYRGVKNMRHALDKARGKERKNSLENRLRRVRKARQNDELSNAASHDNQHQGSQNTVQKTTSPS